MPEAERKKIVYLFGAGATHAELQNLDPDLVEEERGLLMNNVSSRVIERARRDERYLRDVEMVSGTSGSLNIELLISLIENSKIHDWEYKTQRLKALVQKVEWSPFLRQTEYSHIHYVDFSDYSKIIGRADNWREAFQSVFRDRESALVKFKELEQIRNDIAHARDLNRLQLEMLRFNVRYLTSTLEGYPLKRAEREALGDR